MGGEEIKRRLVGNLDLREPCDAGFDSFWGDTRVKDAPLLLLVSLKHCLKRHRGT